MEVSAFLPSLLGPCSHPSPSPPTASLERLVHPLAACPRAEKRQAPHGPLTTTTADDGNTPTLGDIGPCSVDLYTGSVYKQVQLQNLAASVDVSKTAQIMTTIDPSAGETGQYPTHHTPLHNV